MENVIAISYSKNIFVQLQIIVDVYISDEVTIYKLCRYIIAFIIGNCRENKILFNPIPLTPAQINNTLCPLGGGLVVVAIVLSLSLSDSITIKICSMHNVWEPIKTLF